MRQLAAAALAILTLAGALPGEAFAQAYPKSPVRIIVTFPPGGAADTLARAIARSMSESLGQSVIIENRPGAAGNVGMSVVAHAQGDGYTLGVGTLSTLAINPALAKAPSYDARKDLIPVAMMTELPNVLAISAQSPFKDFAGLIDFARANPDKMNYATNGPGSSSHIVAELMKRKLGFEAVHVPYGGDAPILSALLGQQIFLGILAPPATAEFVKSGKIIAPAISGPRRISSLPGSPTLAELGHPDLTAATWFCIVAPAGTPQDIVTLLHREINKAMAAPDTLKVFATGGLEPSPMPLAPFQAFVRAEQDKWAGVIRTLGIILEQ